MPVGPQFPAKRVVEGLHVIRRGCHEAGEARPFLAEALEPRHPHPRGLDGGGGVVPLLQLLEVESHQLALRVHARPSCSGPR